MGDKTDRRANGSLIWLSDRRLNGKSISEISRILLLTEGSVRTYRNRIMKKLEISSLAKLIKFAIKHGLTELD